MNKFVQFVFISAKVFFLESDRIICDQSLLLKQFFYFVENFSQRTTPNPTPTTKNSDGWYIQIYNLINN